MSLAHRDRRHLPVGRWLGVAAAGVLAVGILATAPAWADGWHHHHWHRDRDWHHHWHRHYYHPYYRGGVYVPPPVVYGNGYYYAPGYYAPPPVVYGPGVGVGVTTPGFSIGVGIP